jgi:hypothetical protein
MDEKNPNVKDAKQLPSVPVTIQAVNCYTVHIDMHVQLGNLLPEALRQWAEWLETRSEESAGGGGIDNQRN